MIKTFEEACEFVLKHKVVSVFGSKGSPYPSLWDSTDLSDKKPDAGGWSPRVTAVWDWKTRIPQTFPEEIFYGKIPGGDAVLMEMNYLREVHYPQAYQPVEALSELAQDLFECICLEPWYTGDLRREAMDRFGCTKSRFDTALKKLQISLNIVRSLDPRIENDYWLPFREVYLEIYEQYQS